MEDRHLDHPGDIHWWRGQGPADVIGPCPHDCAHRSQRTLAWGPDLTRYELVRCDDVCEGTCRAWTDGGPDNTTAWLHVDVPARPVVCPCRACARLTDSDESGPS